MMMNSRLTTPCYWYRSTYGSTIRGSLLRMLLSSPSNAGSASSLSTSRFSLSSPTSSAANLSGMFHQSIGSRRNLSSSSLPLISSNYQPPSPVAPVQFPSLIIRRDSLEPKGSFAQAQAAFLNPDQDATIRLRDAILRSNTGIVAHYYMDVELQGVLQSVKKQYLPHHIGIADSLKMGDMAVEMVRDHQCTSILCLGVDFMSESVQAILSRNGFDHIPVYRASQKSIGCSLAESAERDSYQAWLIQESTRHPITPALHVIYINTSLETKAISNSIVPTITCTSSNVLNTLLQAWAQINHLDGSNGMVRGPGLRVLYGPDTYMGHNLQRLLDVITDPITGWDNEQIRNQLHPYHNRDSLLRLREALSVFPMGNCIVHHMFGAQVVDTVRQYYSDVMVTAHLEVPGEMFEIALQKSLSQQGVVGSTSDILNFITTKVQQQAVDATSSSSSLEPTRLRFILGTEAGMVTSIVQSVQRILQTHGNNTIEAEIIFPVAPEAIMIDEDTYAATNSGRSSTDGGLVIVPGVSGGEGCSTAGGCATCPFMKMNSLDALQDVLDLVSQQNHQQQPKEQKQKHPYSNSSLTKTELILRGHLPPDRLKGKSIQGRSAIEVGSDPILYMREFMKHRVLPDDLVHRIVGTTTTTLSKESTTQPRNNKQVTTTHINSID